MNWIVNFLRSRFPLAATFHLDLALIKQQGVNANISKRNERRKEK